MRDRLRPTMAMAGACFRADPLRSTLSLLFRLYSRRPSTDLTNGFRAYRLSLFDDPRIQIDQDWLDDYEFEYYVQHGHSIVEARGRAA